MPPTVRAERTRRDAASLGVCRQLHVDGLDQVLWTLMIFLSLSILRAGHCFRPPVPRVNSDTTVNAL